MRCAAYARYSSDLQKKTSIEDVELIITGMTDEELAGSPVH